jgi:hypothetical protein
MAITLHCSCGKTLKVDEKHRGKKAKCPECGTSILIQEAETAVSEKPKRRPQPVDDDADDDAPKSRKPVKRKAAKKSSMTTWLLAGGCGLFSIFGCLVCGGAIGAYFWFFNTPEDMNYVHDGVAGFVSVRVADIWKNKDVQNQMGQIPGADKQEMDKKMAEMESKLGMKIEDLERFTMVVRSTDLMKKDFAMIWRTSKAMDRKKIVSTLAKEQNAKEKEVKHDGGTIYVLERQFEPMALYFVSDRTLIMTETEDNMKSVLAGAKKPAKHPAVTRGIQMASSGKHQVVIAFELKSDLMKNIPEQLTKQAPTLRDVNGVIFAGTLAKDLAMEAVLTYPSKEVAVKGKTDIDALITLGKAGLKANEGIPIPPTAQKFMDSITTEQRGGEVVVKARMDLDVKGFGDMPGFGMGGGGGFGGGGTRMQSSNNLKMIGLAMHGYHDAMKALPNPAILHPQTKQPILSWRVALLPYLDEGGLFKEIRMNEPWNSPHNSQFHNRMPKVYVLPGRPNDGRTFYQVFQGNGSAFPPNVRVPLVGIVDGTSNTMLVTEASMSVNWMEPRDINVDNPGFSMNMLGNHWGNNTFHACMGDGTVRPFARTMPIQNLRAFITRAGGEVVVP